MRVLIVDDHPLIRKGFCSILSCDNSIDEIFEAANVHDAIQMIKVHNPEITMIDLKLGKENGLQIVNKTKNYKTFNRFIILTSSIKKEDFIMAIQSNVHGYILKNAYASDILYAIHVIQRGKKYYDPKIVKHLSIDLKNKNIQQR
ncbi:response regulator [Abyssisolibacter fermentans]|uniref:response regulator n=1 Tax=Abyssisolibacter fermentans TaxID=1766203 RepID=UPI000833388A|nr:response regulator transcription factor [Abyssisolibacter fermentans]